MSRIEIGLLVSALVFLGLLVFFQYEAKRGVRILPRLRTQFDFLVIRWTHTVRVSSALFFKRMLKQVLHFMFHSFLHIVLKIVRWFEHRITRMIRANYTHAHRGDYSGAERNKLGEIALHKIKTALTEEEKERHKESVLRGE